MNDEVDFVNANNHESFLQIDTMIFIEPIKYSQNFKNSKFSMPLCLQKEVRYEVDFLHADKHQSFV